MDCKIGFDMPLVDFLNELSSRPGHVHITKQTLDQIGRNYIVSEGTEEARSDEFLREHKIQTFLISPNPEDEVGFINRWV